jgi:hypothetical protein
MPTAEGESGRPTSSRRRATEAPHERAAANGDWRARREEEDREKERAGGWQKSSRRADGRALSRTEEAYCVGNSPTLCGESVIAWFIRLRVQPPDRLAFWGSVGPRNLKPAAIRVGACVAARQPGWARRVCGRPRRTHRVSAVRFQHIGG